MQEANEVATDKEKNAFAIVQRELTQHMVYMHGRLQVYQGKLMMKIEDKRAKDDGYFTTIKANLSSTLVDLETAMKAAHAATVPENLPYANILSVKENLEQASSVPSHFVHNDTAVK